MTNKPVTKLAVNRILDDVWTLEYIEENGSVNIIKHSRYHAEGVEREKELPEFSLVEDSDRNVLEVEIDGCTYPVSNPRYIFSY